MYQTILYNYSTKEEIKSYFNPTHSKLLDTGSIFLFFENKYNEKGFIKENLFEIISLFCELKYNYINTIVYPVKSKTDDLIKNNVAYILWFVKDYKNMFFNKDIIREKHIWKDVEWGKREKNYNPKGKDPGNVWIPTQDNGKGEITEHLIMNIEGVINRCINSTCKKNDKILIKIPNINESDIIYKENVIFEKCNYKIKTFNRDVEHRKVINEKITNEEKLECNGNIYFSSSEKMFQLKEDNIDLMITSPPYWDLKNYFKKGQIGQESYDQYLSRINEVWKETYRVLKDNGNMWININIRTKNKKPILIPNDIIMQCKKLGFSLKDIIIWHKSSGIPTHKKNVVDRFEYFLWFVKSHNFKLNDISINDYKNIEINQGLIWNINRKAGSVGKNYIHPAIYPDKLIDRIIKLCSDEGDTILDPFLGSGTTLICALNNKRNCIGYEFNEEFLDLIKHRINKDLKINRCNIKYHTDKIANGVDVFRKSKVLNKNQSVQIYIPFSSNK